MKTRLPILFCAAVGLSIVPLFTGCYTQLETMESAYDESSSGETEAIEESTEVFERDYPPPNYYVTFSYYHPGFTVGYGPYDPWDWYYYPPPAWYGHWYPSYYYYPVYSCWPYYSSWYYPYYPTVYYGHGSSGGGYYPGGRPSDTRDFGNSRGNETGLGTRGRGGIVHRTGGDDPAGSPVTISRPSRQGGTVVSTGSGKKASTPRRGSAVNRPPTRRTEQPQSPPAERGNSGSTRGGSDRGSVSTPPRSSQSSTPSNSPPRGSFNGGGSGGGSRGGSPRTR